MMARFMVAPTWRQTWGSAATTPSPRSLSPNQRPADRLGGGLGRARLPQVACQLLQVDLPLGDADRGRDQLADGGRLLQPKDVLAQEPDPAAADRLAVPVVGHLRQDEVDVVGPL